MPSAKYVKTTPESWLSEVIVGARELMKKIWNETLLPMERCRYTHKANPMCIGAKVSAQKYDWPVELCEALL